uniref:Uncharacterized protein n=1 Tax=viral metagenome TaxID=1070528 RepID=A0A6C0I3E9_9ZZZZ
MNKWKIPTPATPTPAPATTKPASLTLDYTELNKILTPEQMSPDFIKNLFLEGKISKKQFDLLVQFSKNSNIKLPLWFLTEISTAQKAKDDKNTQVSSQFDKSNGFMRLIPIQHNYINTFQYTAKDLTIETTDKSYKPNGLYKISSSSYANINQGPFKAFNGSTTEYWKTNFMSNMVDKYNTNQIMYNQNPYTGTNHSTYQGGTVTDAPIKNAVKNMNVTSTGSSYFVTTAEGKQRNKTKYAGEWIQVNLPYKIYLQKMSLLTPVIDNNKYTYPRIMTLLGGNPRRPGRNVEDGDWNTLSTYVLTNAAKPPYTGQALDPDEILGRKLVQPLKKYSCFRLVITQAADYVGFVSINQWNLWGTVNRLENEGFTTLSNSSLLDDTKTSRYSSYSYSNIKGGEESLEGFSNTNNQIQDGEYDIKKKPDRNDVALHDAKELSFFQENIHALGLLAITSVLILAVLLAK